MVINHENPEESKGIPIGRTGHHSDFRDYDFGNLSVSVAKSSNRFRKRTNRKGIQHNVARVLNINGYMSVEALIVIPIFVIIVFSAVMGSLHFIQYEMVSSALNHCSDPVILKGQLTEKEIENTKAELESFGFKEVDIWAEDVDGNKIGTGEGQVVFRNTLNPDLSKITVKLKATPSINPYQIINFLSGENEEAFAFKVKKVVYSDRPVE